MKNKANPSAKLPLRKSAERSAIQRNAITPAQQKLFDAALLAHQKGDLTTARNGYLQLLAQFPDHADSTHLLGVIALGAGDLVQANRLIYAALQIYPDSAIYCNNYGEVLRNQKQFADARKYFEIALRIKPGYADAINNFGNLALDEGNLESATYFYRESLKLAPSSARTWYNLGTVLHKTKRFAEGEDAFKKSIELAPASANTWNNLGLLLLDVKRTDEAIDCYRQALKLDPAHPDAPANLGSVLMTYREDYEESLGLLLAGRKSRPDSALVGLTLASLYGTLGEVEMCQQLVSDLQLEKLDAKALSNALFISNYATNLPSGELLRRYKLWGGSHAVPKDLPYLSLDGNRPPITWAAGTRRLRIGYLSPDFKNHSVQYFLTPVLANHDAAAFEVFAYSNVIKEDAVTQRLKALVPHWRDVSGMADKEVAAQIRDDGIDVLIDTSGHTADHRLSVFGYRPAPVQVTWLGYGATTGIAAMDYFLGDELFSPAECDTQFSESVYRLNRSFLVYRPPRTPEVTASPFRRKGHVTLGSLTRLIRLNDQTIAAWVDIAKRIGTARIHLNQPIFENTSVADTVRKRFARQGLPADRLELGWKPPHWAAYTDELDIALDPFPHNAGTTTMEALWMGLPVVSLVGESTLSRFGATILTAVGHTEWLANDVNEYIQKAVQLAADLPALEVLRRKLRKSMRQSPLMDERGLAAAMEAAFVDMCSKGDTSSRTLPIAPVANPAPQLSAEVYANEVEALLTSGRFAQALELSRGYIALNSEDYRGYLAQGLALRQKGELALAIDSYRKARAFAPQFLPTLMNLGRALSLGGNFVEAVQVMSEALELAPQNAACQSQMSHALFYLEKYQESETAARTAIGLDPKLLDAWQNLGNALRLQSKNREAQLAFEKTIEINPSHLDGYTCIGSILKDNADVPGALAVYQRGLQHTTDKSHALWSNYFFVLNYEPDAPAAAIAKSYRDWGDAVQADVGPAVTFDSVEGDAERPLRLGLVSGDFCTHVVRHFLFPWLEKLDRNRFELFLYSNGKKNDMYTERFRGLASQWRDIAWLSEEKAHQAILEDEIDILVDLSGHTAGNRLNVFARRAAPCQVAWIGTGYTTGLTNIDYFLADSYFVSEGAEAYLAEKVIRFPFAPFAYLPEFPSDKVSDLPALKNGYITFGCLSRAVRLNHKVISVWAKILQRLPTARLRLDHPHMITPELRAHLQQQFAEYGVGTNQLELLSTSPHWHVFDTIDIALDPFPHNAGTSTIEAMWKGVPVLSLADRPPLGRFGAMFLHAVDLDNWVATNEDSYVELAVQHAQNVAKLAQLRAELRRRLETSVLFDGEVLSVHLAKAFEMMWQKHCAGQPAEHFRVPAFPRAKDAVLKRGREAVTALKEGQYDLAAHMYKQIVLFNPAEASAWSNLGACFQFKHDRAQAIHCFRKTVEVDPSYVSGWYNLGVALQEGRRLTEAEVAYKKVLEIDPNHDQALNNLGVICLTASRGDEALSFFQRALTIHPDRPNYRNNLGNLLERGEKPHKAIRVLKQAVESHPDNVVGYANLAIAYRKLAMFTEAMEAHARFNSAHGVNHPLLFTVNYHPDLSAQEIFAFYRQVCSNLNQTAHRAKQTISRKAKLKVGLVGGDFRGHAAIKFLMPFIECHDPARIELVVFANQVKEDGVSQMVKTSAKWVNVYEQDDNTFCGTVENLEIDILIDVAGWTDGNRLCAMAMKPAPVQVTWLGYGYTTGLDAIDWFVGDAHFTPMGCESLFSEKIYRLPRAALCFHGTEGLPPISPLPARAKGNVTLGYMGRPVRLNDRVIRLWSSILTSMPFARLILDNQPFEDVETRTHFQEKFTGRGVRAEQLVMRYSRPHWTSFADIDIALDPFPHNAGTTTVESLLMGVPVLSLRDRPSVGRFGDTILHSIALDDWVVDTEADYLALACNWGMRLDELASLRLTLRERFMASPLGDSPAFARDFTNALFDMWNQALESAL